MSTDPLEEVFAVLKSLGFERREPAVARVPERRALVWVEVKSFWAKPSGMQDAFVFGIHHSYPHDSSIVAGYSVHRADAWFDAWLARAAAAPTELLAERRPDGSGVIVWCEPPTRASVFARLLELNKSRMLEHHTPASPTPAAPAGVAPAPPAPRPSAVVAGIPDPARAWQALAGAGAIPPSWVDDPRRSFRHLEPSPCPACGGTGGGQGYGETTCYEPGCSRGYLYTKRFRPAPQTVDECVAIAEHHASMARFEALAFDLLHRTVDWRAGPNGGAAAAAPSIVRWTVFGSDSKPILPCILKEPWQALAAAVPDGGLPPQRTGLDAPPEWAARGSAAWSTAVSRGAVLSDRFFVPRALVGRRFAELVDPFVNARELEAMPYGLFGVDTQAMSLWAYLLPAGHP